MKKPKDPSTEAEWRVAVALAKACLLVDSARRYGLIAGGPPVDVDRCIDLVGRGETAGYIPTTAEVDVAIKVIIAGGRP